MGDIFGKYQLVDKIADGGMAEVFRARQEGDIGGFSKEVAIKRMFQHLSEEQDVVDMFLDEGRIAASLNHPNIVQVYDLGVVNEHLYIAMELVEGNDLRSVLEKSFEVDNPLPLELAASIVSQVAAGLHYAHTRTDDSGEPMNIVHRDVSPQNILLSRDGAVKLCDFGIAKAEHRIGHTKAGQIKGKWSYMAPEQIEGGDVTHRTDIFALGIILYETTTMTRLFQADNQYDALEAILYAKIPKPSTQKAGYPAELERIVLKALARDPASRYATAEEMQLEIEQWLVDNQASTSPVHIARYIRNLFGDSSKKAAELTATAEIDVSEEEVLRAEAGAGVAAERSEAEVEEARRKALQKKDVTEMDEDDLDFALDNALGVPSDNADPFAIQKPSEASEVEEDAEPAKPAPKPNFDPEATVVTDPDVSEDLVADSVPSVVPETTAPMGALDPVDAPADAVADHEVETGPMAVLRAQDAPAPEPEPEPVQVATEPKIAPAPAADPTPAAEPSRDAAPTPAVATAPTPAAAPPPAARSGAVPAAPPRGAGPPPSAASQEARAHAAMEAAPKPPPAADYGEFDDVTEFKTGGGTKALVVGGIIAALIGIVVLVAVSWDTSDSTMAEEAEKTNIDPALLEIQIPDPPERVSVPFEVTPAPTGVVVNGLRIAEPGGQLPLVKGERNEVRFYAENHYPAVKFVDGEASGSPVSVQLQPIEEPDPEAVADLEVMSEPTGALIFVDGVQVGTTPTTIQGLSTEFDHHVQIEKGDRFSYAGLVGLVKKSQNLVQTKLPEKDSSRKNYVELIFSAVPKGSIVKVDGEQIGSTKSFKNYDRNQHLEVEFTEKDSRPSKHYVDLEGVATLELRPFLAPMKREKGTITIRVDPEGPDLYVGANSFGTGPAEKLEQPEGPLKVTLDSEVGRGELQLEVYPNTHTEYVVSMDATGKVWFKKQ